MSESKHTPTPWIADGSFIYALDETGRVNRFSTNLQRGHRVGGYRDSFSNYPTIDAELEANATLIVEAVNSFSTLQSEIAELKADHERLRIALVRISELTPVRANSRDARDLHLTVKAIADTALDVAGLRAKELGPTDEEINSIVNGAQNV